MEATTVDILHSQFPNYHMCGNRVTVLRQITEKKSQNTQRLINRFIHLQSCQHPLLFPLFQIIKCRRPCLQPQQFLIFPKRSPLFHHQAYSLTYTHWTQIMNPSSMQWQIVINTLYNPLVATLDMLQYQNSIIYLLRLLISDSKHYIRVNYIALGVLNQTPQDLLGSYQHPFILCPR